MAYSRIECQKRRTKLEPHSIDCRHLSLAGAGNSLHVTSLVMTSLLSQSADSFQAGGWKTTPNDASICVTVTDTLYITLGSQNTFKESIFFKFR